MSRHAIRNHEPLVTSDNHVEADVTVAGHAERAAEISRTVLRTPREAESSQVGAVETPVAPRITLVPPPGGEMVDGLFRELAARGARTSWLPPRSTDLADKLAAETLEQDFFSREPVCSLPTPAPDVRAAPQAFVSTSLVSAKLVLALVVTVLIAAGAWSLWHG